MSPTRAKLPSQSAALAGLPVGVQSLGPWMGRRQLFVRFAGEAETATIFTADALAGELTRLTARSPFHSIAIVGGDPLAQTDFLCAAFRKKPELPVMLDHDGQRPEQLDRLLGSLDLVQVTVSGVENAGAVERICDSITRAAGRKVAHALAIVPSDDASDAQLLRIVEQVDAASPATAIVLHPSVESAMSGDRRWLIWLEHASSVHGDVRLLPLMKRSAAGR